MKTRTPRRSALGALLLLLGVWGCGDPPPIQTYEFGHTAPGERGPLGPDDLADSAHAADAEQPARVAAESLDEFDEDGEPRSDTLAGTQLVVRVVDEVGAPVREADVFVFEPIAGEAELVLHEMSIGLDSQSFLERRGDARSTDIDGLVRVALFERDGLVGARAPGKWGSATIKAEQAEVVVVLQATEELLVRVVGSDGTPRSDVPVALSRQRRGELRDTRIVETGADGLATFGHPGELFARAGRDWEWSVSLAVPLADVPTVVVAPDAVPAEPIELLLPPTASMVVELIEVGGEPFDGAGRLTVAVQGARGRAVLERYVDGESHVRVPQVEPGLALVLEFQREGSPGRHRVTAAAPLLPDIETEFRFVLSPEHPVLFVRLVDEDDVPIASRRVTFRLRDDVAAVDVTRNRRSREGARDTGDRFATTDELGRLQIDLPNDWAESAVALSGAVATIVDKSADASAPLAGVFEVPPGLLRGPNDIGKVVLAPPPVLVAGVVVDELGIPIADASIALYLRAFDADGREQWRRLPDLGATTGADGSFEITSWSPGTPLALRASTRNHVRGESVPFQPGTRGLVVTLIGAGRIAGALRVPEGVDTRRFDIGVVPAGVEPTRDALARASLVRVSPRRGDGEFELIRVPPGSYSVWVAYTDLPGVLFLAPNVLVRSGATTRDPRLDPVDLRNALKVFDLRFLEPNGDPVAWATARWRVAGEESWRDLAVDRGRSHLVADGAFIDVQAVTRGVAPTEFNGITSSGDLTFDPALEVSVKVPKSVLPDPKRYRLQVILEPQGWPGGRTTAQLDDEGLGTFASAGPGEYVVRFSVQRRNNRGRNERTFNATPPEVVRLDARSGAIELSVDVPRAALTAAVEALR